MWIENVSLKAIIEGYHRDAGDNSMLIQIVDPDMEFPIPKNKFKEVHQFKFLDLEEQDQVDDSNKKITDSQAQEIVRLLQHALNNGMNVVVHCVAGICRSGAVCEVGTMMGFDECKKFRVPNLMVKHKMMKVLGWTYDSNESMYSVNGGMVGYF